MNDLIAGAIDLVIAAAGFLGLHTFEQGRLILTAVIAINFCILVVAAIARADREEEKLVTLPVRRR